MQCWFGIDFDPDEREESVRRKVRYIRSLAAGRDNGFPDPYEGLISEMRNRGMLSSSRQLGKIPVEYWLTSKPSCADLVNVANYAFFADSNGCKEYAIKVRDFVQANVFPDVPMMIGVDHSSTGGSVEAVSHEYGSEEVSLIILDSHFDAILPSVRCGLVQYDLETNAASKFSKSDPFLFERPESYNTDSFVYYLVNSGSILPENLIVLGVSDRPPTHAFDISDERVRNFVDSYLAFEMRGSKIVTKRTINSKGVKKTVTPILDALQTRYAYISVDIDIGANSAHSGSRYLDVDGMTETQIYLIATVLRKTLTKKRVGIAGFDIMETNVHRAGKTLATASPDRTYEIEAELTSRLFQEVR